MLATALLAAPPATPTAEAAAPVAAATAAPGDTAARVDALLRALAGDGPAARLAFREERGSALLDAPLVLEGVLARPAEGVLVREVATPYVEVTTIRGEEVTLERAGERTRRFSLRRAPELGGLLASFQALVEADRGLLERHYALALEGDAAGFALVLTPRERRLARRVARVTLLGADGALRCLHLEQADGGEAWMWVGDAAAAAALAEAGAPRRATCGGA